MNASVMTAFERVWTSLFSSPVHLDSAISKLPKSQKSVLAQIIPRILLRPVSQAEILGVGVAPGEPWSLSADERARWRPARLIAERLYEGMSRALPDAPASEADFPPQMLEEWRASWGETATTGLSATLGREPPLSLRASLKLGPKRLLEELRSDGDLPVRAAVSAISPAGLRLAGYAQVMGSKAYERGEFEIQDEGSQLMAWFALAPQVFAPLLSGAPGEADAQGDARTAALSDLPAWTLVDACAGAGGKSLAWADALGGGGRIYSYDVSAGKLQALRRRAKRAGVRNIQTVEVVEGRESEVVSRFRHRADVVLVDAPCSGWGVLRRNPDIKWRQSADALARMPEVQSHVLEAYSGLVKPGGRLVYGVCTFRLTETREVVERFLKAHPEFRAGAGGFLGPGPCDGFFMQEFLLS